MKIDFVMLWVDGNDPAWLEQKSLYSPQKINYSNASNRFRDWDIFPFKYFISLLEGLI